MDTVVIKKRHDKRVSMGHLWVFSNELVTIPDFEPGTLVELKTGTGRSFGYGFYNPHSLIAVRLLVTSRIPDTDFFAERFANALSYRQLVMPGEEIYRLVFGESDLLPGLIVDRFGDYLAMQVISAGMEKRKDNIIEALLRVLPDTKGIIEKNNSRLREMEGLEQMERVAFGEIPDTFEATENGIKLLLSLSEGQKTGYFLDQKVNRKMVGMISRGLNVLDCYCNQGGFALNAAAGGAANVTGIDSSALAVGRAKANAEYNHFENVDFVIDDVADFLTSEITKGRKWDMIILDPPAFAKNKKSVPAAIAGYARINKLALSLIPDNGFLVTSSCSHHISEEVFYGLVLKEAAAQGRRLKIVYRGLQAPDHPVLAQMDETQYLKFFIFQVM